ncbi:bifunctional DNA primase/polymerase [Nocardia sp. NBC_01377]|uniref:bifunctional DNA primase/polymerase n=1 Tax=Nocardia sp. NBC_01377 TaxID=2903595 RepID=UPI002F90CB7D
MGASRRGRPSTALMQAALTAAERGHHVFPLRPRAKTPAYKGNWLHHATDDPRRIRWMWRQHPFNIGIACEPSGLYVIDLDPDHDEPAPEPWTGLSHGREVLAAVAEQAGHPYPGDTYAVATPSTGLHLYFQAPPAIQLPNTSGTLGWRIDTRGTGGYIVAAGSILHNGGYTIQNPRAPQPLPAWLVTALTPPPPTPRPPAHVDIDRAHKYVKVALRIQGDRVRHAPRGQRNDTLVSAAASLGILVGADILDQHGLPLGHPILGYRTAYDVLYEAASTHIGIGDFTEAEAVRTITRGLDYGSKQNHQIRLRGG